MKIHLEKRANVDVRLINIVATNDDQSCVYVTSDDNIRCSGRFIVSEDEIIDILASRAPLGSDSRDVFFRYLRSQVDAKVPTQY